MYRLSPKEKAEVERQLAVLVGKGFVQPSHSAWGAPVIFVAKKSGELRMDSVEFLGHVVSKDSVQVDPKKVSVIRDWPPLRDVHAVQQFLGLGNYFKHYIQGYAKLVALLRKLTEKPVAFLFEGAAVQAFEKLKYSLSHAPVLALPDPDLPFEVVVDASGFGCGAVLLQNQKPVAFHSYKFNSAERNYGGVEQELLAVIALRQWRCHLEGAKEVVVVTDHKPNTYLDSKPSVQLSRRQVRWQEFLSRFDFKWEYRKGSAHVADPISRCSTLMSMLAEWAPAGDDSVPGGLLRQIINGYASDEWFANRRTLLH